MSGSVHKPGTSLCWCCFALTGNAIVQRDENCIQWFWQCATSSQGTLYASRHATSEQTFEAHWVETSCMAQRCMYKERQRYHQNQLITRLAEFQAACANASQHQQSLQFGLKGTREQERDPHHTPEFIPPKAGDQ
eukprot:2241495-Amphidinium_carterae.1